MKLRSIQLIGVYVVDQVKKSSKARYAVGIKEKDEIKFVMKMESSHRNYVLYADMYVNGKFHCKISQNEFDKFLLIFDVISFDFVL
ncbi:MAG TPA: hypothetical protein GXZ90_07395 [Clostridiales bacterium]|nr:hypothetical protein [Clostridiales bacterium]